MTGLVSEPDRSGPSVDGDLVDVAQRIISESFPIMLLQDKFILPWNRLHATWPMAIDGNTCADKVCG